MSSDIKQTLEERGQRYGVFSGHAEITQNLKECMKETGNWNRLSSSQRESLEMIAHKIGRILNGDPNYADSWVDIEGYARLVTEQLQSCSKCKGAGLYSDPKRKGLICKCDCSGGSKQ